MQLSERRFHKSIVTGMSICLPAGIIAGMMQNSLIFYMLAGNISGIALGLIILWLIKR